MPELPEYELMDSFLGKKVLFHSQENREIYRKILRNRTYKECTYLSWRSHIDYSTFFDNYGKIHECRYWHDDDWTIDSMKEWVGGMLAKPKNKDRQLQIVIDYTRNNPNVGKKVYEYEELLSELKSFGVQHVMLSFLRR